MNGRLNKDEKEETMFLELTSCNGYMMISNMLWFLIGWMSLEELGKCVSGSLVVLFYNTLPSPKFVHSDNFGELFLRSCCLVSCIIFSHNFLNFSSKLVYSSNLIFPIVRRKFSLVVWSSIDFIRPTACQVLLCLVGLASDHLKKKRICATRFAPRVWPAFFKFVYFVLNIEKRDNF